MKNELIMSNKSLSEFICEQYVKVWGSENPLSLTTVREVDRKDAVHTTRSGHDKISSKKIYIEAFKLKPSQTELSIEKAVSIALDKLSKNDITCELGAVVSSDFHCMDGHHRWAAAILCNPNQVVGATQINLSAVPLISALNIITVHVYKRQGNVGKGKITDFVYANVKRHLMSLDAERLEPLRILSLDGSIESGIEVMSMNANKLSKELMRNALPREEMPVIDGDNVDDVVLMLNHGRVCLK